jgi:hypothetical protein
MTFCLSALCRGGRRSSLLCHFAILSPSYMGGSLFWPVVSDETWWRRYGTTSTMHGLLPCWPHRLGIRLVCLADIEIARVLSLGMVRIERCLRYPTSHRRGQHPLSQEHLKFWFGACLSYRLTLVDEHRHWLILQRGKTGRLNTVIIGASITVHRPPLLWSLRGLDAVPQQTALPKLQSLQSLVAFKPSAPVPLFTGSTWFATFILWSCITRHGGITRLGSRSPLRRHARIKGASEPWWRITSTLF